jgi:cell division transport system permease protein
MKKVTEEIKAVSEVKEVRFTSREQAKIDFEQKSEGNKKRLQAFEENNISQPLLANLSIKPINAESYSKVVNLLNSDRYKSVWDKNRVESLESAINNLSRFYYYANIGIIAIIIFFALISILVMVNILRITIYQRKDEIEIMRLVGATNNYIRGPFVFEGGLYNIIASCIVAVIFIPGIAFIIPWVEGFLKITQTSYTSSLITQMYLSILGTVVLGIVVGFGTAYVATKRYLKL